MIEEAKEKETGNSSQPKLPLIRLRVLYQNEDQSINEIRFGQQFNQMVANPSEVVKMQRNIKRVKVERRTIDENAMNKAFEKVYSIDSDEIPNKKKLNRMKINVLFHRKRKRRIFVWKIT